MIDIGADLQRAFDEGYEKGKADRPQGKWISKHNGYWTCSECGLSFLFYAKGNFCPNCGARMKGADDE